MAQLPRCVQLAPWKQVCERVGGEGGGATSCRLSIRGMYSLAGRKAAAAGAASAAGGLLGARAARSQCRNALSVGARGPSGDSTGPSVSARGGVGGDDRLGFYGGPALGFSRNCSRFFANGVRTLTPTFARHVSSAEASAIADGVLREVQVKETAESTEIAAGAGVESVSEVGEDSVGLSAEAPLDPDSARAVTVIEAEVGAEKSPAVILTEVEGIVAGETKSFAEGNESSAGAPEVFLNLEEERARGNAERDALFTEIQSKEFELEELKKALRVVDRKQSLVAELVDGESLSLAKSVVSEEEIVTPVYADAEGSSEVIDFEDLKAPSEKSSLLSEAESDPDSSSDSPSESTEHPWALWTQFLQQLSASGHFDFEDVESDLAGPAIEDVGSIKRACLSFARERDDIFLKFPRKDLEIIARFGCPSTDRKVVNAGKRLRDLLAIDEVSVCRPCPLRASCDRRDFKASASHIAGTAEVIRLLSQYAIEVSPSAKEGLQIPSRVQQSCVNLLKETLALSAVPRDPKLPKADRPQPSESARKSPPRVRESKNRRDFRESDDTELKPGDWRCEECQYVNFARNRKCRECDAFRPVPEIRPGDWRCSECQFVNFSRNETCYDCKAPRPAGAGFESSFDKGSRYQRGAPQERGGRYDRGPSRDQRSDAWDNDRASSRRFERNDNERSSSRAFDRDVDRSERWGERQRESPSRTSRDRSASGSRFGNDAARSGGGRPRHEEWKPDFNRQGEFENDGKKDWRSASIDEFEDESADDDLDMSDDDEAIDELSDVDGVGDEELEDMKPPAQNSRGRAGSQSGRASRDEGKDVWWEDDSISRSDSRRGEKSISRGAPSGRGQERSGRDFGRSFGNSSGGRGGGGRDSRGGGGRDSRGGRGRDSRGGGGRDSRGGGGRDSRGGGGRDSRGGRGGWPSGRGRGR